MSPTLGLRAKTDANIMPPRSGMKRVTGIRQGRSFSTEIDCIRIRIALDDGCHVPHSHPARSQRPVKWSFPIVVQRYVCGNTTAVGLAKLLRSPDPKAFSAYESLLCHGGFGSLRSTHNYKSATTNDGRLLEWEPPPDCTCRELVSAGMRCCC